DRSGTVREATIAAGIQALCKGNNSFGRRLTSSLKLSNGQVVRPEPGPAIPNENQPLPEIVKIQKFTFGTGDRFAHQGRAQLRAILNAREAGSASIPAATSFRFTQLLIG